MAITRDNIIEFIRRTGLGVPKLLILAIGRTTAGELVGMDIVRAAIVGY